MKKNITIAILTITSILSIVYGRYQKTEALKQEALAIKNEALAIENAKQASEMTIHIEKAMKLAQEQRDIALANAAEAMRQAQIANELLKKHTKAR